MAFLASSVFGLGGPLLLVPALLVTLAPPDAVALVAPVMAAHGLAMIYTHRREVELGPVMLLALGALPAAAVSSWYTGEFAPSGLQLAVAAMIGLSVAANRWMKRPPRVSRAALVAWGAAIGVTAGLTSSAGPLIALALRGRGMTGARFVASVAALALAVQLTRVPTYLLTGVLSTRLLPLAAVMSAAAVASAAAARPIARAIEEAHFRDLQDLLLILLALWMMLRAIVVA